MNLRPFTRRAQPAVAPQTAILAGIGAAIAIGILGMLTSLTTVVLIMAPFGASCVLLFSAPAVPLSQPVNVVGGHIVSAAVGLILLWILPNAWWAVALAVGAAITAMALLRVTHPPAGANPLVIFALTPGPLFLITPVAIGAILLVIIATAYHRTTGTPYPAQN